MDKRGDCYILEKKFYVVKNDATRFPISEPSPIKKLSTEGLILRILRFCNFEGWEIC